VDKIQSGVLGQRVDHGLPDVFLKAPQIGALTGVSSAMHADQSRKETLMMTAKIAEGGFVLAVTQESSL